MPKWAQVVIVIIIFFAVAGFLERRRVVAMESWRRTRGFTEIDPFVPNDHPHIRQLAAQAAGTDPNGLGWASVITGASNGAMVTFAEISFSPTARQTRKWFTVAVWPAPYARGPIVLNQGGTSKVGEYFHAAAALTGLATETQVVHEAWLTDTRRHALENWPHGGRFVFLDGYAGWMTEGLLTPARAGQLLTQVGEARRVLER